MSISVKTVAPAAGAEMVFTVPAGKYWKIKSLRGLLTTDATVATRIVNLYIDNGTNIFFISSNKSSQAASLAHSYTFSIAGDNLAGTAATTDVARHEAIPDVVLGPGYRIRTVTTAIQAADAWTLCSMLVDEEEAEIVTHYGTAVKLD